MCQVHVCVCVFFKKYCPKMYNLLIFLILSLACFTDQQFPGLESTELEDCFACLEPRNIKCKTDATDEEIDQFRKDENCWYQYYMDKLQELDCVLQKNLNPSEEDYEAKWEAQMMEIRNNFYNTTQLVEDKICNNCTKNDTFQKYAHCMQDYWKNMKTMAETEIKANKKTESLNIYEKCDLLGKKHQLFCAQAL